MQAGVFDPDPPHVPANAFSQPGLYVLTNRKLGLALDLPNGDSRNGSWCMGFSRNQGDSIDHQFWSLAYGRQRDTSTFQNLRGGTFLSLPIKTPPLAYVGFKNVPVWVEGWARDMNQAGNLAQEWRVHAEPSGAFLVQCTRTNTYLEAYETLGMKPFICSPRNHSNIGQLWDLERVSRSSREIKDLLLEWKPSLSSQIFQPYPDNAQYFNLPHELRRSVLSKANLYRPGPVHHAFDYDDFVIKAKDAANSWARDRLRVEGYSVLFGIVYGESTSGSRMYNWYLSSDMKTLVFFDAQRDQEYTQPALDEFGFEPVFASF